MSNSGRIWRKALSNSLPSNTPDRNGTNSAGNVFYQEGGYTDAADFQKLDDFLKKWEGGPANRLYHMATPPGLFTSIIDRARRRPVN